MEDNYFDISDEKRRIKILCGASREEKAERVRYQKISSSILRRFMI